MQESPVPLPEGLQPEDLDEGLQGELNRLKERLCEAQANKKRRVAEEQQKVEEEKARLQKLVQDTEAEAAALAKQGFEEAKPVQGGVQR